jgi:hypothetical protein
MAVRWSMIEKKADKKDEPVPGKDIPFLSKRSMKVS